MSAAILAAVTLHPRGGGIAAVSRLLWQVFQDRWPGDAKLVTLLDEGGDMHASKAMRLRFGARLAKEQLLDESSWVFYSHLSLAQVQTYIPVSVRRPYGIFLHGIEAWRPLSDMQRAVIEGASVLLANSRYTADRIAAAHPWMPPIAACPLALPPAHAAAASQAPSTVSLGPSAVLTVARMSSQERYKGHDQLLDAWPAVLDRVPAAQLVFAGEGDDVPRLRAKAASLGITSSVLFTGFVSDEDLTALYRHAALFAMPSRDEGFGLVYLEAMSHRLPCIGSTHDAARETIEDGRSGFLVPQQDLQTLSDAIARVLLDDVLRHEMGSRASRRVQEQFTYAAFSERIAAHLPVVAAPADVLAVAGRSR